jgi:hypothetical protein
MEHRRAGIRLTEFRPGHIFWMRRGATWLNLDKPRPMVLATRCTPGTLGTLVYGSTRETEARFGATATTIRPAPEGVSRNGLTEATDFYPGILVRDRYERLPSHAGFVGRSLDELKRGLRQALGIGQGCCSNAGAPPGSCRGRIVLMEGSLARDMRTPYAVLVTEPRYSAARRYQLILPLIGDSHHAPAPGVLRLSSRRWMTIFGADVNGVLVPIPILHSIWHARDIARETKFVVDDDSLAEIDRALCSFFSLPEPEAG